MAEKQDKGISLKALVDKENNRVIYAESGVDFVDILFSFLTIPMGTIIGHSRNHPPAMGIGCMNNLYESVEKFDKQQLQTEACKVMLLHPRNGAETHCNDLKLKIEYCNNLKLKIEYGQPTRYFICSSCGHNGKLLSHYINALCRRCGSPMVGEQDLVKRNKKSFATRDGGVFLKGLNRFIITDDLQVMPISSEASISIFSKLGVMDENTIEEMDFNVGEDEVLNMLMCFLVSKTPLSETLLKQKPVPELSKENFSEGGSVRSQMEGDSTNQDGKFCIKLIVSKSRKMVCYAEAGEDFINLLFSFLTVPLGYVAKGMQGGSFKRCINHLYNSAEDLDEQYFNSGDHKAMLTSPELAPGFSYEDQPLRIVEATHQPYYYGYNGNKNILTMDKSLFCSYGHDHFRVMDPKSYKKGGEDGIGFVVGPAMFTITDSLNITPISSILGRSVLKKLQVPSNDIEVRVVHVGMEEALRLLVASFVSESVLTNTFILKVPKLDTSILKQVIHELSLGSASIGSIF